MAMLNNQMVILPSVGYLSHLQRRNFGICVTLPEDEFRAGRDNCAGDYGWNLRFVTGRPHLENGVYPDVLYPIYGRSKMTNHWIGAAHFQSHVYFVENSPTVEPLNPADFIFQLRMMEKSATSLRRWRSPRPGRQVLRDPAARCAALWLLQAEQEAEKREQIIRSLLVPQRIKAFRVRSKWLLVKTLVPSEPQVIAGIYGCE